MSSNDTSNASIQTVPRHSGIITKDEARGMCADELLSLLSRDSNKDDSFSIASDCDFSRSFITDLLIKHGYVHVQGWFPEKKSDDPLGFTHHVSKTSSPETKPQSFTISRPQEECKRVFYSVPAGTAKRWKAFTSGIKNTATIHGYALDSFMNQCRSGGIKLVFDIPPIE